VIVFSTHNSKFVFLTHRKITMQLKRTFTFLGFCVVSLQFVLSSSPLTPENKKLFSSIKTIIRVFYYYRKTYLYCFTTNLVNQIISNMMSYSCTIDLSMSGLDPPRVGGYFIVICAYLVNF
jgi:hypothetical protein